MAGLDDHNRDLISRIDERTKLLQSSQESFKKVLDDIKSSVDNKFDNIRDEMDKEYTKKSDFDPVRRLVYGFVGFILLSVGGMFIAVLIRNNNIGMEVSLPITPSIVKPHISQPQ